MKHALRLRSSSHVLMVVSLLALAPVPGCGGGGTVDPDPCASGTFDDDGDATTACVAWSVCAAGEYVAASGSPTADRECAACGTGTFSTTTNAIACTAFTECVAGEYEEVSGAASADRVCSTCGSGTFSTTTNASTCTAVTLCQPGQFVSTAGTSTADQACSPCATGSFAAGTNAVSCATHADCQPGTARIALGTATADTDCEPCALGTFAAGLNEASCEAWTACADRFVEDQAGSAILDRTCVAEEWDVQVGTSATDEAMALALDSDGTAYVVGSTAGELPTQTSLGGTDWYLQKFGPDGELIFSVQGGTAGADKAVDVALDGLGHVYVTGESGSGQFASDLRVFLSKYTTAGVHVWTRVIDSNLADYANAVAVDSDGNPYVVVLMEGEFEGMDPTPVFADTLVRRFDPAGDVTWTRVLTSTGDIRGTGLALTDTRLHVAGSTTGALPGETNAGEDLDAFIITLDLADGTDVWARQLGTTGSDFGSDVTVDGTGRVYVAGHTTGVFGPGPRIGGMDVFVVALDVDGADRWGTMLGTPGAADFAKAIVFDSTAGLVVAGTTQGAFPGESSGGQDVFAARVALDGTLGAVQQLGSPASDLLNGLAVDAEGVPHVVGRVGGALPGQTALGGDDAFFIRLAL